MRAKPNKSTRQVLLLTVCGISLALLLVLWINAGNPASRQAAIGAGAISLQHEMCYGTIGLFSGCWSSVVCSQFHNLLTTAPLRPGVCDWGSVPQSVGITSALTSARENFVAFHHDDLSAQ